MKFDEFDLYDTLHDIYLAFEREKKKPRSADWLIYHSKRKLLVDLVVAKLSHLKDSEEEILKAWDDFGKNKEKYKLLVPVARKYGSKCFYHDRNMGCCSQIMSVERTPLQRNEPLSIDTAIIVCKKHHSERK